MSKIDLKVLDYIPTGNYLQTKELDIHYFLGKANNRKKKTEKSIKINLVYGL